jgi:predicted amidophosphoribosyltransferase
MSSPPRIVREKRTIRAMVTIYCRAHHGTAGELCPECRELLDYASGRLDRCFFGAEKPACAKCPVHCYKPAMRAKARAVMRYAGPRMPYKHPLLALFHWLDGLRFRRQESRG